MPGAPREAVDIQAVGLTLDAALTEFRVPPTPGELHRLAERLRGHIALLRPLVQAYTDRMNRGSVDWDRRQAVLDGIPHVLFEGLDGGAQSDTAQVKDLARTCAVLLNYYRRQAGTRYGP